MRGRPKNAPNKKYFILLKELNNLFSPDTPIAITKQWAQTISNISQNLIITDDKHIETPTKQEKIDFIII